MKKNAVIRLASSAPEETTRCYLKSLETYRKEPSESNKAVHEWYIVEPVGLQQRKKATINRSFFQAEEKEALSFGHFQLGEEIHYWLYDEKSLSGIMTEAGFVNPVRQTPFLSKIESWVKFFLDIKEDSHCYDPHPFFMEAVKTDA